MANKTSWMDEAEEMVPDWQKDAERIDETYSSLGSAGMGAVDSATLGFADEVIGAGKGSLLGGIKTAISKLTGKLDVSDDDVKRYIENRDEFRRNLESAREQNPKSFLAGQLGGGLATAAIPIGAGMKAAQGASTLAKIKTGAEVGAKTGAIQGLIGGTGSSEADSIRDTLGDAAMGGVVGAGIGGLLGGGIPAAGAGFSKLKDMGKGALKLTGLMDDVTMGFEGAKNIAQAEGKGLVPAAEDLLKVDSRATPEVQRRALEEAGEGLEMSTKLGMQEGRDAIQSAAMNSPEVDMTNVRQNVLNMVKRAYEGGSEAEIKQAEAILQQFDEASGILRSQTSARGDIAGGLKDAPQHLDDVISTRMADLDSRSADVAKNAKAGLAQAQDDAANAMANFKFDSDALKNKAEDIVRFTNTNQFDAALKQLKSIKDKLGPDASEYIENAIADKIKLVESNNQSETLRKALGAYKKRLSNLAGGRTDRLFAALTDDTVPLSMRAKMAQEMDPDMATTDFNKMIRRNVEETTQAQGLSQVPKPLDKGRITNDINEQLRKEAMLVENKAAAEVARQKQLVDATMQDIAQQKSLAGDLAQTERNNLKMSLDEIRATLNEAPEQALNTLDSIKEQLNPDAYNALRQKIAAYSKIPQQRKGVNALEAANAMKQMGGDAAKFANELESLVPDLSKAAREDEAFKDLLVGLGLNPDKLGNMPTAKFADAFDTYIKSAISNSKTGGEGVVNALDAALTSQSVVAQNVAKSVKDRLDTLSPLFKRLNANKDPLFGNLDDGDLAKKVVNALGGGKISKIVSIAPAGANKLGAMAGKAVGQMDSSGVDMFNKLLNTDGTSLKKIGTALSASPDDAAKKLGTIMTGLADKTPDKRRVLLFSVQQNPEYRQMLKEFNEESDQTKN